MRVKKFKKIFLLSLLIIFLLIFVGIGEAANEEKEEKAEKISLRVPQVSTPPSGYNGMTIGLSFKFSGGLGYLLDGAGDLNTAREGREAYYADIDEEEYYTSTFDWKKLMMIPDFKGDLIINIGKYFGLGFGSGLITKSSKGEYGYKCYDSTSYYTDEADFKVTQNYKIQAIPLNLDLYFFLPMGDTSAIFVYGGLGYYLGKLTHESKSEYTSDFLSYYNGDEYGYEYDYNTTEDEEATCNSLGFRGGLGLKVKLSPNIFFGIELFGRLVTFKNWEGDYSYSWNDKWKEWDTYYDWSYEDTDSDGCEEHGFLWIYEYHSGWLNDDYSSMWIWEETPSGSNYKNVKKASINLNTFGILFSIGFHFDLF